MVLPGNLLYAAEHRRVAGGGQRRQGRLPHLRILVLGQPQQPRHRVNRVSAPAASVLIACGPPGRDRRAVGPTPSGPRKSPDGSTPPGLRPQWTTRPTASRTSGQPRPSTSIGDGPDRESSPFPHGPPRATRPADVSVLGEETWCEVFALAAKPACLAGESRGG